MQVEAAVDVEGLAGHAVAQGAGEEEAGGGDVGGEDAAVEALIGDDGADIVGVGVDVFAFGFDGTGGDGVDVDVVAAHFAGEGACEAEDGAFGGDVVDELFDADPDGDGADVDDFAGAAGDHVGEGELAEVHEAFDVDGLHAVPVGFGGFEEEAAGVDAGVVDEGVDVAVAGDGGVDSGFTIGTVGDVALEGVGGAAGGIDMSGFGLGSGFVDIEDVDVGAVLGEEFGDARADAESGAGDEGDVVVREHREQDNAGGVGWGASGGGRIAIELCDMTRQDFLRLGLGAAATGMLAQEGKRPNILFVLCDDMGWGDLPSFGHRNVVAHGGWLIRGELKTPHLDRLAREGTRFTQFYVASAVCSPSRAGFMTGRFPSELGIHDYLATPEQNKKHGVRDSLDTALPTLPRVLREAGYATGHFGKWHLSSGPAAPKPEAYGIDRYEACLGAPGGRVKSSERIAEETIRFMEENRERPFLAQAWLYDPHSPLHPTEEMMAPYKGLSPRWGQNKGAFEVYYGVLTEMDRQIGRMLEALDRLGLTENTMVVFASDNGPETGLIPFTSHYGGAASAGPFRGLKRSLYEGGIRSPLIVRWPGRTRAGAVDNESVISAVDLLPTACGMAGVRRPEGLVGEDVTDVLAGKRRARRGALLWENRFPVYGHVLDMSPMLAVREREWKLLLNPDGSRVELYQVAKDPSEMTNLAERYPKVVERLRRKALEWQKGLPAGPVDAGAGRSEYAWPVEMR